MTSKHVTVSHVVFAVTTAAGLGLVGIAAPQGDLLVSAPTTEKIVPEDPSVRAGSPRHHVSYFSGGGYHGGK